MPSEFQGYPKESQESAEDLMKKKAGPESRLQSYVGCKIIQAEPMTHSKWLFSQGKLQDNQETAGDGYMVIYEDNYRSWSPKHVFERCYRPITRSEKELI
jgi:hypothetical protein